MEKKMDFDCAGCLSQEIEEIRKIISYSENSQNEIIFTEPYDALLTILCC